MREAFDPKHHDPARHPAIEGARNRAAVRDYLISHPGCTKREAAEALGFGLKTIQRHVIVIRREWQRSEADGASRP